LRITTASEQNQPLLLVYNSDSEDEVIGDETEGDMANKNSASKVTGVETYAVGNAETYRKSGDGLEGNGSGSVEMTAQRVTTNAEEVDPEVLEHAIQALENKKTSWWAYLTTKDFWLVLLIGYALLPRSRSKTNQFADKCLHFASRLPTPSPLCW
jgi:solute carrier family 35, member F1/2